jgi:pyruvate formate lyase activating enzyme
VHQLVGRRMTVEEVMAEALKDQVFFDESQGGITLSGGEPLFQPEFTEALLASCKSRRIHTVLDTCGFAAPDVMRRVIKHVDLFHYDLKLMNSERHRRYTGVRNDAILHNLKLLAEYGRAVMIRVPIIPGVNDDDENIDAISEFISRLHFCEVDLLPYHQLGNEKYKRLSASREMPEVDPPTTEHMNQIAARMRRNGCQVRIGD